MNDIAFVLFCAIVGFLIGYFSWKIGYRQGSLDTIRKVRRAYRPDNQ